MHKQRYYSITLLVAILVAASSILFLDYRLYAQPAALSCPRQQTVVLNGSNAPPLQGLIVLFAGQVVGGGFSDPAGNWRIPLRVNEPPGIYPIEIRLRSNQQLLASMLCYVDVPLLATATSLPTATPLPSATAIVRPTTALPAIPTATASVPSPTRPTATPTSPLIGTPTATGQTNGTPTATATASPMTPTPTSVRTPTTTTTPEPAGLAVTIEIFPYDPEASSSLNDEFVTLYSQEENDISIAGWRIVNISRPERPTFVFPPFILSPEVDIYVFTGPGSNNPNTGDFYWGRSQAVWRTGDIAQLLDAQGRLVSAYQVP
ncbi:lamin tail domain-containing protein [Chloroflexus sp.]|uniref:lamin tail domain-containing protein n=1 Tax=Chloroflexus sp. TaxID=1904827 RepID=UPI00404B16C1